MHSIVIAMQVGAFAFVTEHAVPAGNIMISSDGDHWECLVVRGNGVAKAVAVGMSF